MKGHECLVNIFRLIFGYIKSLRSTGSAHLQYWVTQMLPQIYTANHATFPIQIRRITVQICGNFWVTQYIHVTVLGFPAFGMALLTRRSKIQIFFSRIFNLCLFEFLQYELGRSMKITRCAAAQTLKLLYCFHFKALMTHIYIQ